MENSTVATFAILALTLCVLLGKRIDKMQQEIDLLVDGDIETLKLKRKLNGYRDE